MIFKKMNFMNDFVLANDDLVTRNDDFAMINDDYIIKMMVSH